MQCSSHLKDNSRAHWLLARLTLEQNLKPAKFSMIHKFFDVQDVYSKFLRCDKAKVHKNVAVEMFVIGLYEVKA